MSRKDVLKAAVDCNDIDKVRKLIDEGAYPPDTSLLQLAMTKNHIEIIKLFVEHCKAHVDHILKKYIFKPENNQYCRELLVHILKGRNRDVKFVHKIFYELIDSDCQKPLSLEIFQLLLAYGLSFEDCCFLKRTPLQHAVERGRVDFVSLLLQRGANVNRRTFSGNTLLFLAVNYEDEPMVNLLLKRRASVNAKTPTGETALHAILSKPHITLTNKRILCLLLKYGADIGVKYYDGRIPLRDTDQEKVKLIVREVAKLAFEGRLICLKNLEHLSQYRSLNNMYGKCLEQLSKMKSTIFYNDFSMYDILRMRRQPRKLIMLTKNKDFVAAFKSCWKSQMFYIYGLELNDIFQGTLENKNILLLKESKLKEVFKDALPELVICEVAYNLAKEDFYSFV